MTFTGRFEVAALLAVAAAGCNPKGETTTPGDTTPACYDEARAPYVVGAAHEVTATSGNARFAHDATALAEFEINRSCGVLGSATEPGVPFDIMELDTLADTTIAATVMQQLVDAGIKAIAGIGIGSVTQANAPIATTNGVVLGAYVNGPQSLVGCTPEQLADPSITKSETPVYSATACWDHHGLFFWISNQSKEWGRVLAKRALQLVPTTTRVGMLIRVDPTSRSIRDGAREKFIESGVTDITITEFPAAPTVDDFKTAIIAATVNDPQVMIFAALPSMQPSMLNAFISLRDDPTQWGGATKPAGFNNLYFVGQPDALGGDFTSLSPTVLAFTATNFETISGAEPPPGTPGLVHYKAVMAEYDPNLVFDHISEARTWDHYMLFALAATKAGRDADGPAIAAAIRDIANAPGTVVHTYKDARDLILAGEEVDYEGASGPLEYDSTNYSRQALGIFRISTTGARIDTGELIADD